MTNRNARVRLPAILAMKYASGKARIASVTVTAAAIPIVRPAIRRYVGSLRLKIARYWSSVHVWTIAAVNESLVQKDDTSIAPSEAA